MRPTDDYLSLASAFQNLEPMTILSVFFLTLARLLPIVTLAPFLGSKNVPGTIRILFSLSLLAIFLPQNLMLTHHQVPYMEGFIAYVLKEMLIGFILGFLATIPFLIAQMTGTLIDFQRGASSLQVSDPTTQTQTSPLGLLCNFSLIALFYSLNGPFLYLEGVAESYRIFPATEGVGPEFFMQGTPFWTEVFSLVAIMFRISVQLSAPALIGVLITDLFLGIANRLAPQVQIVFLGMALKSWVGIALMTLAWALMLKLFGAQALDWFRTTWRALHFQIAS